MYELMFYGGLALATALLIAAVFFFILFKIPSVHRYFIKYSHRGLVQAAPQKGEVQTKSFPPVRAVAPKRVAPVARQEEEEEDGPTQLLEWTGMPDQTEILERTEVLLDKTELLQVWAGPSGEKTELLDEDTGPDPT